MRSVASLTPLRADISRMLMPGSETGGGTAATVAQGAASNNSYRIF